MTPTVFDLYIHVHWWYCFFPDNMKSALIAKVAMQAFDYYQEAVRLATFYEVKGLWDKVFSYFVIDY